MNKEKIKYFVYARKSSESEGRQVLSVPGQLENISKLIEKEELEVVETITDARSAMTPYNRPLFTNMIRRIKKGEASGIVLWHLDRLARNSLEWGELQYLLQTGVIKSIWTMGREYMSKDSILLMSIEAGMATQYSIDLSQKVRNGLDQKAKLGQPNGVAKLGYLNTKLAIHGTNSIIVDPDRWSIMRKAFDLMLSRQYSVAQITDILNNEYGLRSRITKKTGGRPIHPSIMYRTFTDPFYYGYFYYNGNLYKGTYKPMITVEEFDQIQGILGRKGKPKPSKHTFPFTGLIKCGTCGCAITATKKNRLIKQTGTYKTYVFYHCTKRKGKENCTESKYITESEMETMIMEQLMGYVITPQFRELALKLLNEDCLFEIKKQKEIIKNNQIFEEKLLKELDALLDLLINNTINEEVYLQKKNEKEAQLVRVRGKKSELETLVENEIKAVEEKLDFAVNAVENFKNRDKNLQKNVCVNFGRNWVLTGKKLEIERFEWFTSIKRLESAVDVQKGTSEPTKSPMEYSQMTPNSQVLLALRSLREDVRTGSDFSPTV